MSMPPSDPESPGHSRAGENRDRLRARPITVAVDRAQPAALTLAAEFARVLEAPLRVLHAYWAPVGSADLYLGQDAKDVLRDAAQRVLDEARERLGSQAPDDVEYALKFGPTVPVLEAESEGAAVVVLGTDDTGWFDRHTGRGVAHRTAMHGRCPVAVVPERPPTEAGDVVAAVDIDNVSQDALRFAVDISSRLGAHMRVVSVVQEGLTGPGWDQQHARLDRAVQGWRQRFSHVDIRTQILASDVSSTLVGVAGEARLLVVGRPTDPWLAPLFSRPVAKGLLRAAACPVVVVPVERRR